MSAFGIVEIDGVQPTPSGQLPVVSVPPEPPPGTDPVPATSRIGEGDVTKNAPQELTFAVPAGKRLTVNQLTGGAESSVAGARVDLFHRLGATEQRITAPLFLNGATQQIALMRYFTVGSIVLRRTNLSSSRAFIYAEWDGFLEDI